ncbi:LemA family protein [Catenisphaera adipataccumulans]|jgi:LemA protein|uniref:LemA protein n=1 Tax=Catenisphaera adipataccumulans TaxID=700500 RepID=A0A7W8CVH2_9FIRM|nr:LemA family protein [Catenisphaera adipataccumulans]MBB5182376.1 LemA protein [Catenisphaera adipataccumulans]
MIILIIVIAVIVIWLIAGYNGFVRLRNNCDEAYATMDVYLKKRFDLIPNLVDTVKGYTKYESETLKAVVDARNRVQNAGNDQEKLQGETQLTGAIRNIFALAEAYPDLKASENFNTLMQQLNQTEQDIANARKYYNAVVKQLNTKCESFPSNLIAGMFHFTKRPLFEAAAEERENVKVNF